MATPKLSQWFLNPGEVLALLGASRNQLQRMLPYVPHIHVRAKGIHLFPREYFEAFGRFLKGATPYPETVWEFNRTQRAQTTALQATQKLQQLLTNHTAINILQVMALLHLKYPTLMTWAREGLITVVVSGDDNIPFVDSSSLARTLEWRLPQ